MKRDTDDTLLKAADSLGQQLLAALVLECKMLPDIWPKMSKSRQDDVIGRLRKCVEDGVTRAVTMIAADGRTTADAILEQVVFKNGIKAVFNISKGSPARHALADSEGKLCLIVVVDAAEHLAGTDKVQGEADQREMNLGKEYKPDSDGEGMDGDDPLGGDPVDADFREVKALPNTPLDSELEAAYAAGRAAAENGDPMDSAPMARFEIVERWTQGWRDWHDELERAPGANDGDEGDGATPGPNLE